MRSLNWFLWANLIFRKIQYGGGRNIENQTFGHKLAMTAYICTEFDVEAEKLGPAARFTVKIHISQKSKMAAAAILKSVKWQ